jgi:hypothetical protein
MGTPRHDRSDHNHLYRRIAKSVCEGKDDTLNYEAFDDALLDQNSGLTHAALIGIRKKSLIDAERLLSYHVVESLRKKVIKGKPNMLRWEKIEAVDPL